MGNMKSGSKLTCVCLFFFAWWKHEMRTTVW